MSTSLVSPPGPAGRPRLLDRFREVLLSRRLAPDQADATVSWAGQFLHFHRGRRPEDQPGRLFRHPADMGAAEIDEFLASLLPTHPRLESRTQARDALLALYLDLPGRDLRDAVAPLAPGPTLTQRVREVHCLATAT